MKALIFIILIIAVSLLAMFLVPERQVPLEQKESSSAGHIYASWDTMEFDKCVAVWMIVRFIDKDAKFVLYPQDTEITEGIVFDVPGAEWSRQHRKCTSDCILESLKLNDPAIIKIVQIAHNIELNFWQLDRFPLAQKCFNEIREITEATPDRLLCFEKTRKYFDKLYEELKTDRSTLHNIVTNKGKQALICEGNNLLNSINNQNDYQGVEFCLGCHKDKSSYMDTAHPKKIQGPPGEVRSPVLTTIIEGKDVSIFNSKVKGYDLYLAPWSNYFNEDNVEYTIGFKWAQLFMTKVVPERVEDKHYEGRKILPAGDYAVMGVQWNVAKQKWQDYHGPTGKKHDWYSLSRLTRNKCTGCHTSGFKPEDGSWTGQDSSFLAKGISCESCHNSADGIINPAKELNFVQQIELCGSCHSRGNSIGHDGQKGKYNFPYNEKLAKAYQPGDDLSEFFVLSSKKTYFWPNGVSKKPHQQYFDFISSKHFEAEIGCIDCHTSHHDELPSQIRLPANKLCANCHEDKQDLAAYKKHSSHMPHEAQCIDCHMPYIAKRANFFDIRSHTFDVIPPSETIAQGGETDGFSGAYDPGHIPNSCNSFCHNRKGPGLPKNNVQSQSDFMSIVRN